LWAKVTGYYWFLFALTEVIEDKIQHLLRYLHSINDVIRVFGMEIRNIIDEVDSTMHYGLVSINKFVVQVNYYISFLAHLSLLRVSY
jgi:hypothetical protein